MASRNFANSRIFTGHVMPVMIDCNFVVASSTGLGISSLKGPYVQNVFMHTSTTPAAGNSNPQSPNIVVTNPNPASGTIIIQLQDTYNRLYTMDHSIVSALGTPIKVDNSAMTVGVAYVISTLGNTTAAQWLTLGVPAGITPAVGVSFIAKLVGVAGEANTSTSRVAPSITSSAVASIEMVGSPTLTSAPSITSSGSGSQIILQCRDYAGALAAPTDGSIISICLMMSNSSVLIQGE